MATLTNSSLAISRLRRPHDDQLGDLGLGRRELGVLPAGRHAFELGFGLSRPRRRAHRREATVGVDEHVGRRVATTGPTQRPPLEQQAAGGVHAVSERVEGACRIAEQLDRFVAPLGQRRQPAAAKRGGVDPRLADVGRLSVELGRQLAHTPRHRRRAPSPRSRRAAPEPPTAA